MDGREALRAYLEQRRELGESELVLDSLSVDEAMRLLGAGAGKGPAPVAGAARSSTRTTAPAAPRAEPASRARAAAPQTDDWREAIRAAGGAPAEPSGSAAPTPPASPESVHVPAMSNANQPSESPLEDVPAGLVVAGASRAIADDPAFKLESLEAVAAAIASCTRCPLHATAINPVPGSGSPDADFMVVGEAPGANEDQQGVPFVGQAGQLLTKILAAIDLTREDVFVVNVLKHRPPGNRNPEPSEVTACSPYLVRQIELIQPKVILALGTFAAQTLLETKLTIGKLRGQVHRYYGVPLIVTYHPAALLRNPAWKRPTWEDVQLARRILDRARLPGA